MSEPSRPLLRVENLSYAVGGRFLVKSLSFQVFPGQVVGVLGPNGAGKTTTFELLAGLLPPTSGQVFWEDAVFTHEPFHLRARRGLGYLAQEPSIVPELSVRDNLALAEQARRRWQSPKQWAASKTGRLVPASARADGHPHAGAAPSSWLPDGSESERIEAVSALFGLSALACAPGRQLSGGERRRLELARCVLMEARLLLLDEPFTGLDPIVIAELSAHLRTLASKGVAVLMTDHRVRESLHICDRIVLLFEGEKRLEDSAEGFRHSPEAARLYLGQLD